MSSRAAIALTRAVFLESDNDEMNREWVHQDVCELIGGEWALTPDEKITTSSVYQVEGIKGCHRSKVEVGRDKDPKTMPDEILKHHFDNGIADQLFKSYRTRDWRMNMINPGLTEYRSVILAVRVMQVGATLTNSAREYLRELTHKVSQYQGGLVDVHDLY